jgi:Fur family ferric uptake transcriptional regulator
MITAEQEINRAFREHGYKLTPQRRAVIASICRSHEHLTPAALHARLAADHPGIGLVTVYRTLEILDELGLICETHAGGACRSYLVRRDAGRHHHHLICSSCGRVENFTGCGLDQLQKGLAASTGFTITGHLLEFTGLCRACRRAGKKASES